MASTSPRHKQPDAPPPSSFTTTRLRLSAPSDFAFWRTAYSHGWCDLPPFSFDAERNLLLRVIELGDGSLAHCRLAGAKDGVQATITVASPLSRSQRRDLAQRIRTCLRMDEDFTAFHAAARSHPGYRWIARSRAGRLLRAPTVFEDAVKMICTTNCTWSLTVTMVNALVRTLGKQFAADLFSFPSPEAIASVDERFLRERCKTGYRSPYILELARRVSCGDLDVEHWRTSTLPTEQLFAEMRTVKGIGPYAAGNLLRLMGHYDELGLDSWVRGKFSELHTGGRRVEDAAIAKHYKRYGRWRGLLFWLEMTRDWHEEKFRRS
jgi:3-methyladenine DNA glycosylase/8-oxoguanine DNA glycosylase